MQLETKASSKKPLFLSLPMAAAIFLYILLNLNSFNFLDKTYYRWRLE
jgi:hypothetical protein